MGRKIPAKKHRGVKDPLVQQAKRIESLKGKINAPPRDPDEQPVPKSLLRLFGAPAVERRERKPRDARPHRKGGGKGGGVGGKGGGNNPVAKLQRLPGESVRSFSKRITGATRALHTAEDPHFYPEDEDEEAERPARRRRGGGGEDAPRETKAHRRKLKMLQKKLEADKAREADAASELVYERVSFGEQAHAPPALPAPRLPRTLKESAPAVPRPGRRQLLLSGMFPGGAGGDAGAAVAEARRLAAVAAYRALRTQRRREQAGGGHQHRVTRPRTTHYARCSE